MSKKVIIIVSIIAACIICVVVVGLTIGLAVGLSGDDDSSESKEGSEDLECDNINTFSLTKNEGFLGNPLKGFCAFHSESKKHKYLVPLSLEYLKLKLYNVSTAENTVNFTYLEEQLNIIANRSNQAVVRIVCEEPGNLEKGGKLYLPEYLKKKISIYPYTKGKSTGTSPEYNDPYFLSQIGYVLKELGKKYDGDKRIGYWQLGVYGHWGEWHNYYNQAHEASEETQQKIVEYHTNSFKITQLEIRRPEALAKRNNLGFFDDMFMEDCSKYNETWNYNFMRNGIIDNNMTDRWETKTFGGEESPGDQIYMFTTDENLKAYLNVTKDFHISWMLSNYVFERNTIWLGENEEFMNRRNAAEKKMGYNYYIDKVRLCKSDNNLIIDFDIFNQGVAPFYYDWYITFGLLNESFNVTKSVDSNISIKGILPNQQKHVAYKFEKVDNDEIKNKNIAIQVNSGINCVKFSNNEQRDDCWLIFGKFK